MILWNYLITQTTRSLIRSTEARIPVSYTVSLNILINVQSKAQCSIRNPIWLSHIKMKEKKSEQAHIHAGAG